MYFHLDLLKDVQRLSMGEFDNCNYLDLLCLFISSSYDRSVVLLVDFDIGFHVFALSDEHYVLCNFKAKIGVLVGFRSNKRGEGLEKWPKTPKGKERVVAK